MANASNYSTDEVFQSRKDLMAWVQNISRSLGYVVVTKRSRTNRIGNMSKIVLGCDRGGVSRTTKTNDPDKDTGSKKINCPFELVGKYSKTHGGWLRVVRDEHNHPPLMYMEGHAYAMRLSENENRLVQDLTRLNVKPRDILSTLKKQNENNVSSLKTIHNARQKFRMTEKDGRTPIQNLFFILQSKGYVFEYHRTHHITNELKELFFVHPTSLQMWQAFPDVVLMDATYKTNKYNLPFLEIVGITSTNKTFCIAFAFMDKEKTNNYTWALTCLKLTVNAYFCPRVIVTDRDLALMKACAEVFPQSNHLLRRWHIENDIIKHCRRRITSQQTWVSFFRKWNTFIASPTTTAYMNNYADLRAILFGYPGVLSYLHTTWLDNYAEKFVSVWTDKHLHFGNSTTNRVESQHAKLKKHLDTTKCDLDRFILVIEDVVKSQEGAIKESLERSRVSNKNKYKKPIFRQLNGSVSHHAMKTILDEIDRSQGFMLTLNDCGCQLRSCFGLPCAHELAMYVGSGLSIPIDCIDSFWTKLDLLPSIHVEYGDVRFEKDMKMYKETYNKQPVPVKSILLRNLREVFDPSTNLIVEPLVKKNNRGRPKKKRVDLPTQVPHRHSISNFGRVDPEEMNNEAAIHSSFFMDLNDEPLKQQSYMMELNEDTVGQIPYSNFRSLYMHPLMKEIPKVFHPYIRHIENVLGDGNCGFRAVATCLGYGEHQWLHIREQLLHELLNAYDYYKMVLTYGINEMHTSLFCSESPAPKEHWMVMSETGILIANKFGVIVHYLSNQGCVTCFPLWKGPEYFQEHKAITIAYVYANHFVMVQLEGEYPMPSIYSSWIRHRSPSAVGWKNMYMQRLELYKQLNPCKRDKSFIHIEDNC